MTAAAASALRAGEAAKAVSLGEVGDTSGHGLQRVGDHFGSGEGSVTSTSFPLESLKWNLVVTGTALKFTSA